MDGTVHQAQQSMFHSQNLIKRNVSNNRDFNAETFWKESFLSIVHTKKGKSLCIKVSNVTQTSLNVQVFDEKYF